MISVTEIANNGVSSAGFTYNEMQTRCLLNPPIHLFRGFYQEGDNPGDDVVVF